MRTIVDDTKQLSLNINNNNNNIASTTIRKYSTLASTSSSSSSAGIARSSTLAAKGKQLEQNKASITMQKQKQPLSSATNRKSLTTTTTTAANSNSTGAIKKIQKTVSQKSQQDVAPKPQTAKQPHQQQQIKGKQPVQLQKQQQPTIGTPKKSQQQQQQPQVNNNATAPITTIALPKAAHANSTNEELAGGVQDTIYLCNFRVSVDGEWLCLKELQDVDVMQQSTTAGSSQISQAATNQPSLGSQQPKSKRYSGFGSTSAAVHGTSDDNGILSIENFIARRLYDDAYESQQQPQHHHLLMSTQSATTTNARRHALENGIYSVFGGGGGGGSNGGGASSECTNMPRDTAEIERSNLVNICKLVVKELLEQSLRYGRMLDSDHLPLQHFFIVIEHVLGHGLRPKKGLLGPRKELWDLLQSVEHYCPEAQDITASVRDLPTVRTHTGRARAWLRIALMQKKLADYLQALIEHRDDALYEYYEPFALMMSDEIVVIMGILVGLNVIDCNLCVKEEDLDSQQGVIDFSLYLRSSSRCGDFPDEPNNQLIDATGQGNMIAVLDQKNYIEELNRHLNATVGNLQAKVEQLTTTNALMKEDLAIARNSLLALQAENQAMRQNANVASSTPSLHSVRSDNSSNSSGTDKQTVDGLTAELAEEKKKNVELDKELKLQISLKAESDMAMKLLEKDIHEKQDTIVSLRRQLDDIKQINLEMYRKLQDCEASIAHKSDMLTKLEAQKEEMTNTIAQLEKKWTTDKSNLKVLQTTSQALSTQMTSSEERAARAEAESRIEREWRISLQEKEVKLKEKITSLQIYVKELNDEALRHQKVKDELEQMRKQWAEAQITLEELGIQLSVSKLRVSEFQEREKRQQQKQTQSQAQQSSSMNTSMSSLQSNSGPDAAVTAGIWAPDSIATHCTGCQREFNLTRRKHHCRSCGDIFCKNCSEHTLALLNEQGVLGKPVRVCDGCYGARK